MSTVAIAGLRRGRIILKKNCEVVGAVNDSTFVQRIGDVVKELNENVY